MKRNLKKYLAMLFAFALVCSMLTACGSGNSGSSEANTEATETEDSTEAAETEDSTEAAETEDSTEAAETESSTEAATGEDTASLVDAFLDSSAESESEEDVTLEYDANGTVVPGTYTYDDYKADMDFSIIWTFILYEDGSYDLSEDNPFIGVSEYGGQTSEIDGNRVNCGEMDADRSTTEGDWAYPTGFSILLDVDTMTFQPENVSDEVFGRDEGME